MADEQQQGRTPRNRGAAPPEDDKDKTPTESGTSGVPSGAPSSEELTTQQNGALKEIQAEADAAKQLRVDLAEKEMQIATLRAELDANLRGVPADDDVRAVAAAHLGFQPHDVGRDASVPVFDDPENIGGQAGDEALREELSRLGDFGRPRTLGLTLDATQPVHPGPTTQAEVSRLSAMIEADTNAGMLETLEDKIAREQRERLPDMDRMRQLLATKIMVEAAASRLDVAPLPGGVYIVGNRYVNAWGEQIAV